MSSSSSTLSTCQAPSPTHSGSILASYELVALPTSNQEVQDPANQFDSYNFLENFPPTQIVNYHEICENHSQSSGKEIVVYRPKIQHLEDLHQILEGVVKNVVNILLSQANLEKQKTQRTEENTGQTSTQQTVTEKKHQSGTKQVAHISNVSFQLPKDFEINNYIVNEFVPEDEIIKEIITKSNKIYNFSDRLHGWNMDCRMRQYGGRQLDLYFTHIQSNIVMRSVPEIMRFLLFEVNPKQMREANRKRKVMNISDQTAHNSRQIMLKDEYSRMSYEHVLRVYKEEESYVEMVLRVAHDNLMNNTTLEEPSLEEWTKFKTANKKAKTSAFKQNVGSSDSEAANLLIKIAKRGTLPKRRHSL